MPISDDNIRKGRIALFAGPSEFNHRGQILLRTCKLEWDLTEALLNFIGTRNTNLNRELALQEMFKEGPLSSLKKLADTALHLGVIGPKTHHDLVKFYKLRIHYAHDRDRGQLDDDHHMYKLLQDTYLYKESVHLLASIDNQGILFAIHEQLAEYIRTGHKE